jgi:histidine ammonia-lyase
MGTIAARDCMRVLQLTEQVAAAALMMGWQGVKLRLRSGSLDEGVLSSALKATLQQVADKFSLLEEDRELEGDLRRFIKLIQQRHWRLYDAN